MATRPLAGRIALITGASRGLGRAVALAMARAGAHVILLARTVGALEEVDDEVRSLGSTATLLQLDLRKADNIDALGPTIYQRWGRLDILVGNAATLGPLSPLGHVQTNAWSDVMAINLTANWRLIRTCDPLLRQSDAGRAIFVTCAAAAADTAYWGPYAVSKAGLEALARSYARELDTTPARANLLDPGVIRTALRAQAFPGEVAAELMAPEVVAPLFLELAGAKCTANGERFSFAEWQAARRETG
jgi:NAD(P)-dependent dehydrogenase (short-subunit alcohol dehydrogenase family)